MTYYEVEGKQEAVRQLIKEGYTDIIAHRFEFCYCHNND